jgi:hypothetical protein
MQRALRLRYQYPGNGGQGANLDKSPCEADESPSHAAAPVLSALPAMNYQPYQP